MPLKMISEYSFYQMIIDNYKDEADLNQRGKSQKFDNRYKSRAVAFPGFIEKAFDLC
jgi:hypothetical protein